MQKMIYLLKDNSFDHLAWKGMELSNIEELYQYLSDDDYRVRTLAAQSIQMRYATNEVFQYLSKTIFSSNLIEREISAYILGQLGTPKMPFAEKSLPFLYQLLDDKNEEVLATTISAIGHLWTYTNMPYNQEIVDKIIGFIKHKNPDIRIATLVTLSSLKANNRIKKLINHLLHNDESLEVREWAEVALEILQD